MWTEFTLLEGLAHNQRYIYLVERSALVPWSRAASSRRRQESLEFATIIAIPSNSFQTCYYTQINLSCISCYKEDSRWRLHHTVFHFTAVYELHWATIYRSSSCYAASCRLRSSTEVESRILTYYTVTTCKYIVWYRMYNNLMWMRWWGTTIVRTPLKWHHDRTAHCCMESMPYTWAREVNTASSHLRLQYSQAQSMGRT